MGYGIIHSDIFEDENVTVYGKALYSKLCSMCYGDNEYCWPSITTLKKSISASKGSVLNAIKNLEENNWLLVERNSDESKGNKPNKYYPLIIDEEKNRTTLTGKVVHEIDKGSPPHELGVVHEIDKGSPPHELGVVHEVDPNNINTIIETNKRNRIIEKNSCCCTDESDNTTSTSLISHLNHITGLKYKVTQSVNKQINLLLSKGFSVGEIEEVINRKAKRFKDINKLYLTKPSLFFSYDRFEEYAQEVRNEILQEEQELERSHTVSMITSPEFVRGLNHG